MILMGELSEREAFRDLIDIACSKPCKQSSLSEWSVSPEEASRAVMDEHLGDFAFHTRKELGAWWQVDLGLAFPIEVVRVSNRIAAMQERCRSLKVEASLDAQSWQLLHSGFTIFGTKWTNDAFELWLKGGVTARFIRLSLDEDEVLHLSKVEVFASRTGLAYAGFCRAKKLHRLLENGGDGENIYRLSRHAAASCEDIVGIDINYSGRFGNILIQYINAIMLAKLLRLQYLRLGNHDLLHINEPIEIDGLTLLPGTQALPPSGYFLSGTFFVSDPFVPLLMPFLRFTTEDEKRFTATVQTFIRPHILLGIPLPGERHFDDEVTIHLRSGDVFEPYTPIVRGYRQPPLAYYQLALQNLFTHHGVRRVRLVFQDRGNPCIDALVAWLAARRVPTRLQSGTLHEDLSALVDAPHLILGFGTFGYAVARLSRHIKTVHYFEPQLGGLYGAITTIGRVYSVADARKRYFEAFEYGKIYAACAGWFNTAKDRKRMLSYPVRALVLRDVTADLRRSDAAA